MAAHALRSTLRLPDGAWATVIDCLSSHFPHISHATWHARMLAGCVLDESGAPLPVTARYRAGFTVHYFREIANEPPLPAGERILYADEHIVVADKPHFLPVTPAGRFVQETLLARVQSTLQNPNLVPLHRIDRATAGLVMFSASPATRAVYQALFRTHAVTKTYEAIAPALPAQAFPLERRTRIVTGEPFFRMQEVEGVPNSLTRIDVIDACRGAPHLSHYRLAPVTGKKHQLRVHMAALGAPILHDPYYPQLLPQADDDADTQLQLLARALSFNDPRTGATRAFVSNLNLSALTDRQ